MNSRLKLLLKRHLLALQSGVVWSWWRRNSGFSRRLIPLFVWPAQWPKCYNIFPLVKFSLLFYITTPCKWWCFEKEIFHAFSHFKLTFCKSWFFELKNQTRPYYWWFETKSEKITIHQSLFMDYCSWIIVHWLLFADYCSLFTIHQYCSLCFLYLFKGGCPLC